MNANKNNFTIIHIHIHIHSAFDNYFLPEKSQICQPAVVVVEPIHCKLRAQRFERTFVRATRLERMARQLAAFHGAPYLRNPTDYRT